mgnify:CR=1 FL=1
MDDDLGLENVINIFISRRVICQPLSPKCQVHAPTDIVKRSNAFPIDATKTLICIQHEYSVKFSWEPSTKTQDCHLRSLTRIGFHLEIF